MSTKPVSIRRHAILKHHYRRAVLSTAHFHQLSRAEQWALLRDQVRTDTTPLASRLLDILNSRESRRDEVMAALEDGRQAHTR